MFFLHRAKNKNKFLFLALKKIKDFLYKNEISFLAQCFFEEKTPVRPSRVDPKGRGAKNKILFYF
jgi:hypothetical protein